LSQQGRRKSYLKPSQVAELLRVEPGTIRNWALSGQLRAAATPGGHRRFAYRDVLVFARRHGLSLAVPEGRKLRVLIVDDDASVRTMLERTLGSVDELEVETAEDGFSAGRRITSFLPHVVLLDIVMPGLDGIEICRGLKADPATADIRIIAMTGAGNSEAAEDVLESGAEQCLAKPIARADLLAALGVA
jgi:excisionase family DNA binding protein